MSQAELDSAVASCVETLVRRGRAHLAQRVGAQLERLVREGETAQAIALIGLFAPRS